MKRYFFPVFFALLSGCIPAQYQVTHDEFTGLTKKEARIGNFTSVFVGSGAVNIIKVGGGSAISLYMTPKTVPNVLGGFRYETATCPSAIFFLTDDLRFVLQCQDDGIQMAGVGLQFRRCLCPLNPKASASLAKSESVRFRVNGVVGEADSEGLKNIRKVLVGEGLIQ